MSPANLKPKMTSFLRTLSDRFGSSNGEATKPRPDGFVTAKVTDALFPRTNADTDGDECLHDCATCTIKYPRKFSIDEGDQLYGEIKGWQRHLIVATGKTDWVRDVEDEVGSVMASVGKHRDEINHGKLMLSASNIPVPDHRESDGPYGPDRPTRVLLLPAFQWIEGVTPNRVPSFIKSIVNLAPTNTQRLQSAHLANGAGETSQDAETNVNTDIPLSIAHLKSSDLPEGLSLKSCPHKYLILLCSQATRDARCGQSAPLLRHELERHLRPLGLYRDLHDERPGGVGIYFISHVGGHKYSANMLVYRRADAPRTVPEQIADAGVANGSTKAVCESEAAQCIWLARIRPEDCENIIRYTVLQGKVVKPDRQLRGGFDREKGVVSW